jgi:Ran GTPase-activating protein 1
MDDIEEIRLHGNTLGVEACKVLGEVLETKKTLQVALRSLASLRMNTVC